MRSLKLFPCFTVIFLILMIVTASIPSSAAGLSPEISALLSKRLAQQETSIDLEYNGSAVPEGIELILWRMGVSNFKIGVSRGHLRITGIQYYPQFAVCENRREADQATEKFGRALVTDFRLFLSNDFANYFLKNQKQILDGWMKQMNVSSWKLSWVSASQQLHISDIKYIVSASTPTMLPAIRMTATPSPEKTSTPRKTATPRITPTPEPENNNGKINTRLELTHALESYTERGITEFTLNLSPSLMADVKANLDNGWFDEARANCGIRFFRYNYYERSGEFRFSDIEYRVAVRILNAYRNGTVSELTARESKTLDTALDIVRKAPSEELAREQYLHDTLCNMVSYYTNDNAYEEKDQAIGALLNGKADCDGYSEAFYLLCNLAGIPARFQHGDTFEKDDQFSEATHMWNLVKVKGRWVMVDVTWDDPSDELKSPVPFYVYYNIGSARAGATHFWEKAVLTVDWTAEADNNMRPAALSEEYARNEKEVNTLLRAALINRRQDRISIVYPNGIDFKNNENKRDQLNAWIYMTGVEDFNWKFGGHSIEVLVVKRYPEFAVVENEKEALAYVQRMKNSRKRNFVLFFEENYGKTLFADDLKKFRLLEGQFGMKSEDMKYSDTSYKIQYTDVVFDDYFRVCTNETEIIDYISSLARSNVNSFSICVPGDYGAKLFANKLDQLNTVFQKTQLKNDRDLTYYSSNQSAFIKNAHYWPSLNRCSLIMLENSVKSIMSSSPKSFAIWTDGSYTWTDSRLDNLFRYVYRNGVDSFRYNVSDYRVEFTSLNYFPNFRLVSSEDEIKAYLRECRSKSVSSFRIFCTASLYKSLSASSFKRFWNLSGSYLKNGQSIRYSDENYMIGMDSVKYK